MEKTLEWSRLKAHAESVMPSLHLSTLLQDAERSAAMTASHDGILLDYSRQLVTTETMVIILCAWQHFYAVKSVIVMGIHSDFYRICCSIC